MDEDTEFAVRVTVEQVAVATGMRIDDAILALKSCGLLSYIDKEDEDPELVLVITPESIERVATERKLKPALLDVAHILPLDE